MPASRVRQHQGRAIERRDLLGPPVAGHDKRKCEPPLQKSTFGFFGVFEFFLKDYGWCANTITNAVCVFGIVTSLRAAYCASRRLCEQVTVSRSTANIFVAIMANSSAGNFEPNVDGVPGVIRTPPTLRVRSQPSSLASKFDFSTKCASGWAEARAARYADPADVSGEHAQDSVGRGVVIVALAAQQRSNAPTEPVKTVTLTLHRDSASCAASAELFESSTGVSAFRTPARTFTWARHRRTQSCRAGYPARDEFFSILEKTAT